MRLENPPVKHVNIQGINVDIWRRFRAACVALGVNVGDKLNELMEAFLKDQASASD